MSLLLTTETNDRRTLARLEKLRRLLGTLHEPTRAHAGNAAWSLGFAYFIGGHHVAIHPKLSDGRPASVRVAILTGSSPDWL